MIKTSQFKALLNSPDTEFILEAHSGLSAKIVEEAGFKGIWASGLALSAQHAVRDNNELSWTQVVEALEFMSDATSIPILLDGDTGYGDFNNMRRLVWKLEDRGIAGVCIEDKLFPKSNSFIDGERQALEDVATFCGKIKAGKDAQRDDDFCIVARVEALIAGWGMDEALRRAEAYREAGADAILIHSKQSQPDEVLEFARRWEQRCPLVVVPTKYYSTPTEVFRRHRIALVIWANHMIRAAIAAMQETAASIAKTQSLIDTEGAVATVSEIFRLQGAEELLEAEKRYTARQHADTSAVILAASRGAGLDALTRDRPKVMIPVAGTTVLRRLVDKFKNHGVNEITVVGGYHADTIDAGGVRLVVNADWENGGELTSLACAADALRGDVVVLYGDLLFRSYILSNLLDWDGELLAVVDSMPLEAVEGNTNDLAFCSAPDDRAMYQQKVWLKHVGKETEWDGRLADGRWMGLLRARGPSLDRLLAVLETMKSERNFEQYGIPDLINRLIEEGLSPQVQYVNGHWMDLNDVEDLQRAEDFASGHAS